MTGTSKDTEKSSGEFYSSSIACINSWSQYSSFPLFVMDKFKDKNC